MDIVVLIFSKIKKISKIRNLKKKERKEKTIHEEYFATCASVSYRIRT